MGRTGPGIEKREGSIRLTFVLNGEPCRETLRLNGAVMAPTPANLKYAHRLAAEIRDKIRHGTFEYRDYFPDSPRAAGAPPGALGPLASLWLESKGKLQPATRDQYATAVRFWCRLLGEDTPVRDLTPAVLQAKVGSYLWPSAKTHNNYLIALRGILALEYTGRRAADNPALELGNMTVVRKLPDPLTTTERDSVLADMHDRYDERVWAYFTFAFFSGMRPEEMIALRWSDIDLAAGVVRVQRVRTFRGAERDGSKTHTVRDVDLTPPAMHAIEVMRPYTQLRGTDPDVFENPVTGRSWHDERSQRDHYWAPTLKRLKIRGRRAYCTRHTYCTAALMGQINPAYIAAQAGHSVKVLLEVYARWLAGADGGTERAKMAALSSPELPRKTAQKRSSEGNVGRRDWTRTNLPGRSK